MKNESLFLTACVGQNTDKTKGPAKRKALFLQAQILQFDLTHIQHVIDKAEQMLCAALDLLQSVFYLRRQIFILQKNGVQADDRIQRRAHLMAHAGKKPRFGTAALFRGHELGFQMFIFDNAFGDAAQQLIHDINKDTAAEQNPGHDEIRFPEQAYRKISEKKEYQKNNRNIQNAVFLIPGFEASDIAGKVNKTIYIINH